MRVTRRHPPFISAVALVAATAIVFGACGQPASKQASTTTTERNGKRRAPAPERTTGTLPLRHSEISFARPPAPGQGLRPAGGRLELGTSVEVGSATVGAAGGTVAPGPSLAGFRIEVDPGALDHDTTLHVTSQPITASSYGERVRALSPLVTVEGLDGSTADPMAVTVPATVPADSFAMGFRYDPTSGALEGLPVLEADADSVTLATRHFSSFFVTAVRRALIPDEGATYFRAYEAGWQFPNYGSYVSKGGHCAGMSLTAMWYYVEQTQQKAAPQLFGRFDDAGRSPTPELWVDDAHALRWASTVQQDVWWDGLLTRFFRAARTRGFDALQWDAFRYAISTTGEPQYVTMAYPDPKNSGEIGGAHAMVAYAYTADRLWVYDPNHPKDLRSIRFDAKQGRFVPYSSAVRSDSPGNVDFTFIGYAAKTAIVDWGRIGARFDEMLAGTVGTDRFPAYALEVSQPQSDGSKTWVPLTDGYTTIDPAVEVRLTLSGNDVRLTRYDGTTMGAVQEGRNAASAAIPINLGLGDNALGFLVEASKPEWDSWEWVDFVRLRVGRADPSTTTVPETAPPTTSPTAPIDCGSCPPGLVGLECQLHCGEISPAPPGTLPGSSSHGPG